MSTNNMKNISPTKFWVIIALTAILGIGVGITLGNNKTQAPIYIQSS